MKEKVKEKAAEIIRIITIPPIEALVMLLILYGAKREVFGNLKRLMMAVIFLSVIPICAYPMASGKRRGESDRNKQRNMAFAFNFLSYLAGMLMGYAMGCTRMLQWILNSYFLVVLILTIINKGFKIRASGHACSCTFPYLVLSYFFGNKAAVICLILYLAEFWASVTLKRHTIQEYLGGTVVACLVFAGIFPMLG